MSGPDLFTKYEADFSPCGRYRYAMRRTWNPALLPLVWVMLNPSTADAENDDATTVRCIDFARRGGYGAHWALNLFAFIATEPKDMRAADDPVGPENDRHLTAAAQYCVGWGADVVVAWGADGGHHGRNAAVLDLLNDAGASLVCLGTTKDGHPRHPLYVAAETAFAPLPEYDMANP